MPQVVRKAKGIFLKMTDRAVIGCTDEEADVLTGIVYYDETVGGPAGDVVAVELPEAVVQNTSDDIGYMTPAHVSVAYAGQVFPSSPPQSTRSPRIFVLKR